MPYYAYILRSSKDGKFYYGSTSDLSERIEAHNAGKVRSTKGRRPFSLHYSEEFTSRSDAFKQEKFFKTIDGYRWLKSQGVI